MFVTLGRTFEHLSAFENAIEHYQNYARLSTVDPPTKCHNGFLVTGRWWPTFICFQKESPQCHWNGSFEHQPSTLAAALELHIAPSSCISPLKRYLLLYHKLGKTINEPLKPPQYNMIFHAIVFLVNMVFSSGYCFLLLIFFSILYSLIFSCSLRSQTYI